MPTMLQILGMLLAWARHVSTLHALESYAEREMYLTMMFIQSLLLVAPSIALYNSSTTFDNISYGVGLALLGLVMILLQHQGDQTRQGFLRRILQIVAIIISMVCSLEWHGRDYRVVVIHLSTVATLSIPAVASIHRFWRPRVRTLMGPALLTLWLICTAITYDGPTDSNIIWVHVGYDIGATVVAICGFFMAYFYFPRL